MPNINKLAAGDAVYVGEKLLTVTLVDPIHLFVNAKDDTGSIIEFRPWQLHVPAKKEEQGTAWRKGCPKQEEDAAAVEESAPKRMKNSEDSGDTGDSPRSSSAKKKTKWIITSNEEEAELCWCEKGFCKQQGEPQLWDNEDN